MKNERRKAHDTQRAAAGVRTPRTPAKAPARHPRWPDRKVQCPPPKPHADEPRRGPAWSKTTEVDIMRADNEGMAPVPPPRVETPS